MASSRFAALLLPIVVLAACGQGEEPAPAPVEGIAYLDPAPSAAALATCPSRETPDGLVVAHLVDGSCDPGFGVGTLFTTPAGAFLLEDQTAWPSMVAAFDAADASDAAAQLSLGWAAYQLRRTLADLQPIGWNGDGTVWTFLSPTSGGEEDGIDVPTPYDARFEIAFGEDGNPTGATFVEMCLLPGDWPGSTITVDAPNCPSAS